MSESIDELPLEPFKDAKNYMVKTAFVFCKECNEVLLTPEQAKSIFEQAREQWINEGIWDKNPFHARFAEVSCPKCHFVNYLAFCIQRYKSENETTIFSRYRMSTVQFPDLGEMQKFKEWVKKIP